MATVSEMVIRGNTRKIQDKKAQELIQMIRTGIQPKNLFDKESVLNMDGKYYNSSNSLVNDGVLSDTDLIPVIPGHLYTAYETTRFVNWYKADKTFLGYTSSQDFARDGYVEAIENAAYARFIYKISEKNDFYVWDLTTPNAWLVRKMLPEEAAFFNLKNLFVAGADTLIGKYYNTVGTLVYNSTFDQTGLIPVTPGNAYTSQDTGTFVLWYNSERELIDSTSSPNYAANKYVIAPANSAYARFVFLAENLDEFWVHDLTDLVYVIPAKYIEREASENETINYNASQFYEKKWVSFGDSITYRNTWQPDIVRMLQLSHTNCGIGSTSLSGPNMLESASLPSFWKNERLAAVKTADPDVVTILGGANDAGNTITLGTDAEFEKEMPSDAETSQGAAAYSSSADYAVGSYCTKDGGRYQCTTEISGGEAWNENHWKAVKNVDTFIGAYSYIVENLLTWKRTLSIVILGTTWAHNDGSASTSGITYTEFSEASEKVAKYYGLPFVDLHGKTGFNKFTMGSGSNAVYSDDQIHPNVEGSKQITKLVLNSFLNDVTIH